MKYLKTIVVRLFRLAGLQLRSIPLGELNKYTWLKEYSIDKIIDVGANVGQFALEVNSHMPEVSIYSFEPLKNIYDELVKNVSNRPVIKTFNMALGSFIGSSPMNRNDFSPASSIFELTENALGTYSFISHSEIEEIRVSTLDALMDEGSIDVDGNTLIKMDVQGYEGEVIRGGVKALSKAKVVISEVCFVKLYKNQLIFKELNALLDAVGFDLIAVYDVELDGRNGFPVFGDAVYLNRNG